MLWAYCKVPPLSIGLAVLLVLLRLMWPVDSNNTSCIPTTTPTSMNADNSMFRRQAINVVNVSRIHVTEAHSRQQYHQAMIILRADEHIPNVDVGTGRTATRNFKYSLVNSPFSRMFHANQDGELILVGSFDREYLCEHNFCKCENECEIRQVMFAQHIATGTSWAFVVRIVVDDVNDNGPAFRPNQTSILLPGNVKPGYDILLPTAVDADSNRNGICNYFVQSQTDDFQLKYYPQEDLLKLTLVHEISCKFLTNNRRMEVMAEDCGNPRHSALLLVDIDIEGSCCHDSHWNHYNLSVKENTLVAELLNLGKTCNHEVGSIHFRLGDGSPPNFALDEYSGVLSVVESLNYEVQPVYDLRLFMHHSINYRGDKSPLVDDGTEIGVKVVVEDADDVPVLTIQSDYETDTNLLTVPDDLPLQHCMGQVVVHDEDELDSHHLLSISTDLCVLERTADMSIWLLRLNRPLVFGHHYHITISAYSSGTVTNNVTIGVHVTVSTIPVLEPSHLELLVAEHVEMPVVVGSVTIRFNNGSSVKQPVHEYLLEIPGYADGRFFDCDQRGNIYMIGNALDRPSYQLRIILKKTKEFVLANANVTVFVIDIDYQSKIFPRSSYQIYVQENAYVGYRLGDVALDAEALVADLQVGIEGNQCDHFDVYPNGSVYLADPNHVIDRETESRYRCRLVVRSTTAMMALPTMSVPFGIIVRDLNDNRPIFGEPVKNTVAHIVNVSNTLISPLSVLDADIGTNAAIKLMIDGPMNGRNFLANTTGLYLKNVNINPGKYFLLIVACDKGTPERLCSKKRLTVNIVANSVLSSKRRFQKISWTVVSILVVCLMVVPLTSLVIAYFIRMSIDRRKARVRNSLHHGRAPLSVVDDTIPPSPFGAIGDNCDGTKPFSFTTQLRRSTTQLSLLNRSGNLPGDVRTYMQAALLCLL